MELTRAERRHRVKDFRAEIARRASLIIQKEDRSYSIPNVPFGQPKLREALPEPKIVYQHNHWECMWFFNLVFGPTSPQPQIIRIDDILRAVILEFGVSKLDIMSERRTANVVRPRQVVAYLSKKLTTRSLPYIGKRLGDRDHTTILAAVARIEKVMIEDAAFALRVATLAVSLGGSLA